MYMAEDGISDDRMLMGDEATPASRAVAIIPGTKTARRLCDP